MSWSEFGHGRACFFQNFILSHWHCRDYLLKMPRGRPKKVAKDEEEVLKEVDDNVEEVKKKAASKRKSSEVPNDVPLKDEVAEPVGKKSKVGTVSKITIEHCNSWQKFKRMAKEYLEYFATSYPEAEQVLNPEKPRRGAFNIRYT